LRKPKISALSAALIIALLATAAVFGTVLYTLTIPSQWGVQVAVGLQFAYANGTLITPSTGLPWPLVPVLGSETLNFTITNIGNDGAANVTLTMPANTSAYSFTTTYTNQTIAKGGSVALSITLTDTGMTSGQIYSGNFVWSIVDHFSAAMSAVNWTTELTDETGTSDFQVDSFAVYGANVTNAPGNVQFNLTNMHGSGYQYVTETLEIAELSQIINETVDVYCTKDIAVNFVVPFTAPSTPGNYTMELLLTNTHN
jgi:hypothetical protein